MLIKADRSALVVIDVQERLAPAIHEADRVVDNTAVLMQAAARLGVPTLVTEQYPKGLGRTVSPLADLMPDSGPLEKVHFSCAADPGFTLKFGEVGRSQAVLAGMESHVCVNQTALELLEGGTQVFVVADATSSRRPESHRTAMDRLRAAGATIVTTEMVVFEWLQKAGTPEFKEVSKLIK